MKYKSPRDSICKLILLLVLGFSSTAYATDTAEPFFETVHWAYSSFFGTGWYRVDDNRSVFVLRVPPRQTLRESDFTDTGGRRIGININYPLTVGLHNIEDIPGIIHSDNFGTVSFAPGVELEIPVNTGWYLRPFANVGWGKDLNTGDSAWIYYAGVKSRYRIPAGRFDWSLLGGLFYAGFTPDKGRSDHLALAQLGFDLRHPLNNTTLAGRAIDLHYNFMYAFLGKDLHFGLPEGGFDPVQDQFEAGIAISLRDRPFKLWFLQFDRLGLGYKFSSDGNFKAITLSMRSWFTR